MCNDEMFNRLKMKQLYKHTHTHTHTNTHTHTHKHTHTHTHMQGRHSSTGRCHIVHQPAELGELKPGGGGPNAQVLWRCGHPHRYQGYQRRSVGMEPFKNRIIECNCCVCVCVCVCVCLQHPSFNMNLLYTLLN